MGIIVEKPLPDAQTMHQVILPVLPQHRVEEHREEIQRILDGRDQRLMMIVGPCSAWPMEAVRKYADRLARLQEDVREELLLVLRCYIQKPRTTVGWSGPLNQPDPEKPVDIAKGIHQCSQLMYNVGKQLPLADEMLFTHNDGYFGPRLSYVALGARSGEDMEHRYIASGLDAPVGVKNTTEGNIETGVNGVLAIQHSHTFAYHQNQVRTTGNPYAHLILRGGNDGRPNYDPQALAKATGLMEEKDILHPAIIVDTSHDNSHNGHGKDPELQEIVVESVMAGIRRDREEYRHVRGFMIESFLLQGSQKNPPFRKDGLSITDPCLGWEQTELLLRETADQLSRRAS